MIGLITLLNNNQVLQKLRNERSIYFDWSNTISNMKSLPFISIQPFINSPLASISHNNRMNIIQAETRMLKDKQKMAVYLDREIFSTMSDMNQRSENQVRIARAGVYKILLKAVKTDVNAWALINTNNLMSCFDSDRSKSPCRIVCDSLFPENKLLIGRSPGLVWSPYVFEELENGSYGTIPRIRHKITLVDASCYQTLTIV